MSDYDPFSAIKKKAHGEGDDEVAKEDAVEPAYDPFARPDKAPTPVEDEPAPARADPPPRGKEMEAPPGLAEGPTQAISYGPIKFSGAILVGTGGFLLVAAILALVAFQTTINAEEVENRYSGGRDATGDIELARFWVSIITFPLAALFLTAGAGIFYQQTWARHMGSVLLILYAIAGLPYIIPAVLAIVAAVPLMKGKYARWFR